MTVSGALADLYVLLRLKDEMSAPLDSSGKSLGNWKQKALDGSLAATELASAMVGPIDQAREFDSVTARAALSTGLSETAVRNLTNALWSADTPLEEAAATIERLGREGMNSEAGILATATAFNTLADGLQVPADQLTDQLIPAFNAFGVALEDVPDKVDMLAATFHTTGVDVDDFSKAMQRIGPSAADFGLSMEDICAALVVMKDEGYDGRKMFSVLTAAVSENTDANKDGKISTEELAAALGIEVSSLTEANTKITESAGKADLWADASNKSVSSTEGFNVEVAKLATSFGGVVGPVGSLVGALAQLGPAIMGIAGLDTLLGGSLASGISSIASSISGLAGTIGEFIIGIFEGVFSELAASLPGLGSSAGASLIAGVAAGIALGLAGVYALVKTGALDAIKKMGETFRNGGGVIRDALQVLLAPLGAIGAIAIDLVTGQLGSIPEHIGQIFETAGKAADRLTAGVATAIANAATAVWDGLVGIAGTLASTILNFPAIGAPDISGVAASLGSLGSSISSALSSAAGAVTGWFSGLWNTITTEAGAFLSGTMLSVGINMINSLIDGIAGGIQGITDIIANIAAIIGSFFPQSPAEQGPLSQMPDWSAYVVDPLAAAGGEAATAASAVAGTIATAAPGAAAGVGGGGAAVAGGDTWNVTVNATLSQDYTAKDMFDDIAAKQRSDRVAAGVRTVIT